MSCSVYICWPSASQIPPIPEISPIQPFLRPRPLDTIPLWPPKDRRARPPDADSRRPHHRGDRPSCRESSNVQRTPGTTPRTRISSRTRAPWRTPCARPQVNSPATSTSPPWKRHARQLRHRALWVNVTPTCSGESETTGGGWVYILILLEFQSTVDRRMALRMMDYTSTIWMRLGKEDLGPGGEYPLVLPIVIYNGERRWTAATDVGDLIGPVPGNCLDTSPANGIFSLRSGRRIPASLPPDNVLAMIARFEQAPTRRRWKNWPARWGTGSMRSASRNWPGPSWPGSQHVAGTAIRASGARRCNAN